MIFSIYGEQTNQFVKRIFMSLPQKERRRVSVVISAVTDAELNTGVRPFSFGGNVVHEIYFDTAKLRFFLNEEKVGAILSAFIIAMLAEESASRIHSLNNFPLSDQALMTYAGHIIEYAKHLKCSKEVSSFLARCSNLENQWRKDELAESQRI
jgi:hypothetical protein